MHIDHWCQYDESTNLDLKEMDIGRSLHIRYYSMLIHSQDEYDLDIKKEKAKN